MYDSVIFVSLGPGEAELITLKGLKALQQADVIFCPSTVLSNGKASSRAKDILLELEIEEGKITLFDVPMNKDRTKAMESYKDVSEKIAEQYREDFKVAVTAEGDAGFYSSIQYINDNLQKLDVPTSRIAGIPAFIACGTLANIHIVKQEEELNVIPGITNKEELSNKINHGKPVVIMKPSQCEEVVKAVMMNTPDVTFHYFENAGVKGKEFYTQDNMEISSRKFPYFSLLIIRKD